MDNLLELRGLSVHVPYKDPASQIEVSEVNTYNQCLVTAAHNNHEFAFVGLINGSTTYGVRLHTVYNPIAYGNVKSVDIIEQGTATSPLIMRCTHAQVTFTFTPLGGSTHLPSVRVVAVTNE